MHTPLSLLLTTPMSCRCECSKSFQFLSMALRYHRFLLSIFLLSPLFVFLFSSILLRPTETTTVLPKIPIPLPSDRVVCAASRGDWVLDPDGPRYTNETCRTIHDRQDCLRNGRPDRGFLRWRWRPDGCWPLPRLDALVFLEAVRGRRMAFVGDSLARNHMQSLLCLLSTVSKTRDDNFTSMFYPWHKTMFYPSHNFTISYFFSPFLVRADEVHLEGIHWAGPWNLHLDQPDPNWASSIGQFDYLVISAGNWFARPAVFFNRGKIVGSNYYLKDNIPVLDLYYINKGAFRTALRAIVGSRGFKGTTILRTVSPGHFENGEWNTGGSCTRRRPFARKESSLSEKDRRLYEDQLAEFAKVKKMGVKRGLEFKLLDVTSAMLLRPDGHPNRFSQSDWAGGPVRHDCVHWCLPGPIDTWNDLMFQVLGLQ